MKSAAKWAVLVGLLGVLLGCRNDAEPVPESNAVPARLVLSMAVHPVASDGALFTSGGLTRVTGSSVTTCCWCWM